jgi:molybdopterin-guanine dinucleotide biosynthesis protein MobB
MEPTAAVAGVQVIAVVGRKKTGKTTLIERLIPVCAESGRVAVIKHIHHADTDLDPVATDTWRAGRAGAPVVIGVNPQAFAVHVRQKMSLLQTIQLLARIDPEVRWILVEGFHEEAREVPGARIIALLRSRAEFDELFPGPGTIPWIAVAALDAEPTPESEEWSMGSVEEVVRRVRVLGEQEA